MKVDRLLLTGGSGGIGRAIAAAAAARGWQVCTLDLRPPERLETDETFIRVDLADTGATGTALGEALDDGPITRLVNNAAIVRPATLLETRLEDIDAVLSVNVRAAVQCAQALVPGMRAQGFGRIVNISSRAAEGKELRTAYSASKAALHGLTRTWTLELGRLGITCNAVAPASLDNPLFHQVNPPESPHTRQILAGIPVGRLGRSEDVAHAVMFFLDARSWFVTGQVLHVSGGTSVGFVAADAPFCSEGRSP
jgi:3-oxoacyl-[acyl-carrier protein] reductase